MDLPRFTEGLPGLYEGWGGPNARPRGGQFAPLLARVRGMTTPSVLQLLNWAVACLEEGEVYAEVGCFQGATLIGALLGHPTRLAYAADNFSLFDPHGQNRAALRRNLGAWGVLGQVRFREQDFESFLLGLRGEGVRVGVYFYDGAHDYRSQLLGLLLVRPLLAQRAVLVVDDTNWPAPRQASWDFLAVERECRLLYDLPTPGNLHPSFWNGLQVLAWEASSANGYSPAALAAQRQQALLTSLDVLQEINLQRDGQRILVSWAN